MQSPAKFVPCPLLALVLAAVPAAAQQTRSLAPMPGPARDAGTFDWFAGTWRAGSAPPGFEPYPVFDNTCT